MHMVVKQEFIFDSPNREDWLTGIQKIREIYCAPFKIGVTLGEQINRSNFTCMHFVTLSCVIDMVSKSGGKVIFKAEDAELYQYIIRDIRIKKYWQGDEEKTVFSEPEQKPFNLWRIDEKYYTNYSIALSQYFERTYFAGKDVSGFQECIAELFQNIMDHAEAKGNAFFAISYDEMEQQIEIAICDFGVGIPYTLREQFPNECEALRKSLLPGVSAGTRKHNRGFGMENIVNTMSSSDTMRIMSNKAFMIKSKSKENVTPLSYDFKGTLIHFTISTNSFEDIDIIDELNFG